MALCNEHRANGSESEIAKKTFGPVTELCLFAVVRCKAIINTTMLTVSAPVMNSLCMEMKTSKFIHGGNFSIQSTFECDCIIISVALFRRCWGKREQSECAPIFRHIRLHHSYQIIIAMTDVYSVVSERIHILFLCSVAIATTVFFALALCKNSNQRH